MPLAPRCTLHPIPGRSKHLPPLRVGVGGPVGSGKTTLVEMLCKAMRERYDLVVVTNDIYTKEDQRLLTVAGALGRAHHGRGDGRLPAHRHPRGRLDQPRGIDRMLDEFPDADIVFIEIGGDNLAATFSPELSDLTIYVIDVAAGEKIPRKGGPGITKSDLFVINKTDLAPLRRRRPGRDGSRHAAHARAAAVRDDQPEDPRRPGRGVRFIETRGMLDA